LFINNGCDSNSIFGDPQFKNPTKGDYTVLNKDALLKLGFVNFDMTHFGVNNSKLKSIAKKPIFPPLLNKVNKTKAITAVWMGTKITEPKDESMSAFGVGFEVSGVAFGEIKNESPLDQIGFKTGDLIIGMNGEKTNSINKLIAILATNNNKIQKHNFILIRAQQKINVYYTGKIEAKIILE
jgi:membrane-associated protease RseP (regulator of RpoE activity)